MQHKLTELQQQLLDRIAADGFIEERFAKKTVRAGLWLRNLIDYKSVLHPRLGVYVDAYVLTEKGKQYVTHGLEH